MTQVLILRGSHILQDLACAHEVAEILGIDRGASPSEIKKAYHKAALSSHPDKVAEHEREEADSKFKSISKAYQILYDDEKRHLYDTHGIAAFEGNHGNGMDAGVGLDEMLQQMFGMNTRGGMPPGFGGAARPQNPKKGNDEEHSYQVTLEEMYKGKIAKFASTKNVICSHCKGVGGKEKAKPKQCASCDGKGIKQALRHISPGLAVPEMVICSSCKGRGGVFNPKDKCKKCKGECVRQARKVLEIYIPRGSKEGDRIILGGEADQVPNEEPGDIIFSLVQTVHPTFRRAGVDLSADIEVTLAEALCGFSRVVIKHLDGRGLHIQYPQHTANVLKPGQVIKVSGEGMPYNKSDLKGDLYLVANIEFPKHDWLVKNLAITKLQELLPKPHVPIETHLVDDVTYDESANLDGFGAGAEGEGWVNEDEEEEVDGEGSQCAQQ